MTTLAGVVFAGCSILHISPHISQDLQEPSWHVFALQEREWAGLQRSFAQVHDSISYHTWKLIEPCLVVGMHTNILCICPNRHHLLLMMMVMIMRRLGFEAGYRLATSQPFESLIPISDHPRGKILRILLIDWAMISSHYVGFFGVITFYFLLTR